MKQEWHFTAEAWERNNKRLTNQIFKLLPLYEENQDWQRQRSSLLLELHGYNEMYKDSVPFMVLIAKLESLIFATDKIVFRKLIFEAITALKEIRF